VLGSATAETSTSARIEHAVSVSQLGLLTIWLQPLPPPFHALSAQPRVDDDCESEVPPTATTPVQLAGDEMPYPLSPLDAVMRIPAWL
jgi:hypothetical protein